MTNVKAVTVNNFYDAGLCTSVYLTTCAEFDYENLFSELDCVILLHAFFSFVGYFTTISVSRVYIF
jgi:hypothetical protein